MREGTECRHGRGCSGPPPLSFFLPTKTWMRGTSPGHDDFKSLPVSFPHLRLDLRHARDPAIVILRLLAHVARDLRVRQDDEGLLFNAGERIHRHLLRRKVAVAGLRALRNLPEHVGIDALRAE